MLIRLAAITISAALLIVALVAVAHRDSSPASATPPPFNPGGQMCFENIDTTALCDGNSAADAASDISTVFCIGWGANCATSPNVSTIDESNFGGVAAMIPPAFVPASATSAPVGAIAGALSAQTTLGILNGPCSTPVQVSFTLMIASLNQSYEIFPKAPGLSNPAEPLAVDLNPRNGVPDGADRYPAYLSTYFNGLQPVGRLFGTSKIYGGWVTLNFLFFAPGAHVTTTSGTDVTFNAALGIPSITILGDPTVAPSPGVISDFCAPIRAANVTFGETYDNPCTPELSETDRLKGNCPLQKLGFANNSSQNVGYPYMPCDSGNALDEDGDGKINDGCPQVNAVPETGTDCDNATSEDPEDSAVNDGCPPVGDPEYKRVGTCSGTDEGKCVIRKNPASGTHNFTIVASSQRDADSDGIENSLDVCALVANGDWNPHINDTVNDSDTGGGDGIPNVCDPEPTVKSGGSPLSCASGIVGSDHDGDCFANRADNCPTTNQLLNPGAPPDATNVPNIVDSDFDGIGDACDPSPMSPNGESIGYCIKFAMAVGSPAGPVTGVRDVVLAPDCAAGPPPPPPPVWGDIDCSGAVNSVDALKLLRWKAGLAVAQPQGCPALGSQYP